MTDFVKIDVRGYVPMNAYLRAMPKRIEIAQQRAIIKTAQAVVAAEQGEMQRVFDRPTRFTLNALKTTFDKPHMTATVEVKDGYWTRSQNYLRTQMEGGKRKMKAFEIALQRRVGVPYPGWRAVPGPAADIDAFGNMSVGQIRQILSWFDAAEMVSGSTQNMGQKGRDKKRKGTKRQRGFEYFIAYPGSRIGRRSWQNGRTQNLHPGIYKRTLFGFGGAIKPVMFFVPDATYAKRFRFYEVAETTIAKTYLPEFNKALDRELAK